MAKDMTAREKNLHGEVIQLQQEINRLYSYIEEYKSKNADLHGKVWILEKDNENLRIENDRLMELSGLTKEEVKRRIKADELFRCFNVMSNAFKNGGY
jgi:regulator of replication initiation timing